MIKIKRKRKSMNNFKELQKEQVQKYQGVTKKIKKNVDSNISSFAFIGNIIELYFSRLFNVMINLTNSDKSSDNSTDAGDEDEIDLNAMLN